MSLLGSVPAFQVAYTAGDGTGENPAPIPAAGGDPLELLDELPNTAMSFEVINDTGDVIELFVGAAEAEERLCYAPGAASETHTLQRQPVALSKGQRLSVRSQSGSAVTSGRVFINFWT